MDIYANLAIWNCHHRIFVEEQAIYFSQLYDWRQPVLFFFLGNDFMTSKLGNSAWDSFVACFSISLCSVCPTMSVAGVVSFAARLLFSFSFVLFEAAFCDWMYKWMIAELWCQWFSVHVVEFFLFCVLLLHFYFWAYITRFQPAIHMNHCLQWGHDRNNLNIWLKESFKIP